MRTRPTGWPLHRPKYDEMLKRWGADKTETKEAYASLLSEKTSLAKLQADQYTGLFEDITKRYDTDLGTLEKEYNLWTAQNSNTASKLDKIDRETEYQKDELELKQKKEDQGERAVGDPEKGIRRKRPAHKGSLERLSGCTDREFAASK